MDPMTLTLDLTPIQGLLTGLGKQWPVLAALVGFLVSNWKVIGPRLEKYLALQRTANKTRDIQAQTLEDIRLTLRAMAAKQGVDLNPFTLPIEEER